MKVKDLIKQLRALPPDAACKGIDWAGTQYDLEYVALYVDRVTQELIEIPEDAGPNDPFLSGYVLEPLHDWYQAQRVMRHKEQTR